MGHVNRDERLTYWREYYRKNKTEFLRKQKLRPSRSPEKLAEYQRKHRQSNKAKVAAAARKYRRKKSEEKATRPRPSTCEVCGAFGNIFWDHDHKTGTFRGWLCPGCNSALGHAKDSPETLRKLAVYLEGGLCCT